MKKGIWVTIILIFLTPWEWRIIKENFFLGLLVPISSVFLYVILTTNKINHRILTLFIIVNLIIIYILFSFGFDNKIFIKSEEEIQQYYKRHEFLGKEIGKFYTNRFSLVFYKDYYWPINKLQKNFFDNLDINIYFFASHPRERLGVDEFEKYNMFLLPFFLIGLIYVFTKRAKLFLLFIVIGSLLSSFISAQYKLGPVIFFPIINTLITIGISFFLRKEWIKK